MKIMRQSAKIIYRIGTMFENPESAVLNQIETAARTCYQSEPTGNTREFIKSLIQRGHHSVLEHANISVEFVTDRGVTHELVRHRLAAYSQESTRYCNYSKDKFNGEATFILPVWFEDDFVASVWRDTSPDPTDALPSRSYELWRSSCLMAESYYFQLLGEGQTPQQARAVLPNGLKTQIIMTANVREWRHIFKLRCSKAAHPQMRELMLDTLNQFNDLYPTLFGDIFAEFNPKPAPESEPYSGGC